MDPPAMVEDVTEVPDMATRTSDPSPVIAWATVVSVVSRKHARQRTNRIESSWRMSAIQTSCETDLNLRELLYFDECEDLLRGVPLGKVMRGGAHIFAESDGDARSYALSKAVPRIDAFVSHNWIISRWKKLLVLAYQFNFKIAVVTTMTTLICLAIAGYFFETFSYTSAGYKRGFLARLATVPVVTLATVFGRDMFRCFRGPYVFVDKVCVHQVDADLQRRAIQRLGAFLRASDMIVVCYTDWYLQKLWTVYELACWVTLFNVDNSMKLVHCDVPLCLFLGIMSIHLVDMILLLAISSTSSVEAIEWAIERPLYMVVALIAAVVFRKLGRERCTMLKRIENFSVRACLCAVESDRGLVCANIAALMRASRRSNLTQEEALSRFDEVVRDQVPAAMSASFTQYGFTYRYLVGMPFVLFMPRCADAVVSVHEHGWFEWFTVFCLWHVAISFWVAPICLIVIQSVAVLCLSLRGFIERLLLCFSALAGVLWYVLCNLILTYLEAWSRESAGGVVTYITVNATITVAVAWLCMRRPTHTQSLDLDRERRQGPVVAPFPDPLEHPDSLDGASMMRIIV